MIQIEQIDVNLYSATLEFKKAVRAGSGIIISYDITCFGRTPDVAKEKVLLGLVELNLMVEDQIEEIDI